MGQSNTKADSEAVTAKQDGEQVGKNGRDTSPEKEKPKLGERRTSFYETVDASEVLPYLIIGNLASSKNKEFLSRKNVKYVLNLTNEMEESEGLELKTILLEDDEDQEILPHLDAAFGFINKAAKSCLTSSTSKKDKEGADKATVLVHSYFGMSRSAAIVIAYLMKEKEMCLMDAYQHLKKRHPSVNPNDNFAVQLIRYEQKLFEGQMSMTVKDFHQ